MVTDQPQWSAGIQQPPPLLWTTLPGYSTRLWEPQKAGDVGYDLECAEATDISDTPIDIPCGIAVQVPPGTWGFIHGRSSALSKGIVVYSGIIDEGYRGPLFVRAHAVPQHAPSVDIGSRIAQLILMPAIVRPAVHIPKLGESERGDSGFGSTGGMASVR